MITELVREEGAGSGGGGTLLFLSKRRKRSIRMLEWPLEQANVLETSSQQQCRCRVNTTEIDVRLICHNQKAHVNVYISCCVNKTKYYVLTRKIRACYRDISKMLFELMYFHSVVLQV
jgi:hypothetical protein